MPHVVAECLDHGHRAGGRGRAGWRARLAGFLAPLALLLLLAAGAIGQARAQLAPPVEVVQLMAEHGNEALVFDYQLRVTLPAAVEEAARRGVPLYFTAVATLWKPRWYWRDERVARVRREWRLSFQPLTSTWRLSQGGLGQSHDSLTEALATMTRASAWRVADASQVEPGGRYYLEFDWKLDTTQLPRPLQIGVTGVGGSSDWSLGVERTVRIEAQTGSAPGATATPASGANGGGRAEPK